MTGPASGTSASVLAPMKPLGDARDGLLLLAACVYGLGYAVRTFYAWRQNLGVVPALDSQYFLAGVAPALMCVALYAVTRHSGSLAHRLSALVEDWPGRWRKILFGAVTGLFLAGAMYLSYVTREPGKSIWAFRQPVWVVCRDVTSALCTKTLLMQIYALVFLYSQVLLGMMGESSLITGAVSTATSQNFKRVVIRGYLAVTILFAALVGLVLSYTLYRNLPQELGGLRPDIVAVELLSSDISPEAAMALFPSAPAATASARVVRSIPLSLLSSQGDYFLVRPVADTLAWSNYRLKKDLVRIVIRQ